MDYGKQIERYRSYATRWEHGEQLLLNGEIRLQDTLREAAAAIETLLAERDTMSMSVQISRLKELAEADAHGMVVVSKIPIGTTVYQLHQGTKEEVRIIDGEEYTRKVPNWYITTHKYSWVDAIADAECPERRDRPNCRYYFTLEEVRAERDRINAGGDPNT